MLEWYPPGRLVVWAAVLAALVVLLQFQISVRMQKASVPAYMVRSISYCGSDNARPANAPLDTSSGALPDRLIDFLVSVVPLAAAVLATITNLLNLWLAGRVVKFSGRLARPWPQLAALTFPPLLTPALAAAIALSFVDGMLGIVAGVISASLLLAYGVLGFAVLHTITQGMNARALILSLTYAAVITLGWPMLALCLLGLIDAVVGLRGRILSKHGPPAHS